MKFLKFFFVLLFSILWILILNKPMGEVPSIGLFFNPLNGFWANSEKMNQSFEEFKLPPGFTKQRVKITLDDRSVPHISAKNDEDLYFAQGYLHASFRLWQMDMQTRAAAGRLSEVVGAKTFEFDRNQRRKGMLWAAEGTLVAIEKDSLTKIVLDAYTRGVNAYLQSLHYAELPIEYKLMGFVPEEWTNLKTVLMVKAMADDLTGKSNDIAMSYLRSSFSEEELNFLFPDRIAGADPVIPSGTAFAAPSRFRPREPSGIIYSDFSKNPGDSAEKLSLLEWQSNSGIGSNNWAVQMNEDSSSTKVILCNDPHLGLSLPSIWFEIQLTAPDINFYGVSLPGAPGIIIGFNDYFSVGVTNNYRDVKDYYEIVSEDPRFYSFDDEDVPFNFRIEKIMVKGKPAFLDTVRYSIHGPVQYDQKFPEPSGSGKTLAVSWMGHKPTNELKAIYKMNRAKNYEEFVSGISLFECPAQNFIYADRDGNIALWGQGRFVNKWKGQGKYVMRGDISATLWKEEIPMSENPHVLNPRNQNYLASANQVVTDDTYPYWYNGDFSEFRSWEINRFLKDSTQQSVEKMMAMQNNNWSYLAEKMMPFYYDYGEEFKGEYSHYFEAWDGNLTAESKMGISFQIWWHFLYQNIWKDDFSRFPVSFYPSEERTMQIILSDTASKYFDDIHTPEKETFSQIARRSFQQTWDSIAALKELGKTEWYQVKNTSVTHLAKLESFSFSQLKTGGWGNTINAMKQDHGPTWRMIVQMSPDGVEAYGTYPGGQSGNPGSKHYSDFLQNWVTGKYFKLNFIPQKVPKKTP